jgi:hypothetical protein
VGPRDSNQPRELILLQAFSFFNLFYPLLAMEIGRDKVIGALVITHVSNCLRCNTQCNDMDALHACHVSTFSVVFNTGSP